MKGLYLKNYDFDERNWIWHKQMERYTMLMDWNNKYY